MYKGNNWTTELPGYKTYSSFFWTSWKNNKLTWTTRVLSDCFVRLSIVNLFCVVYCTHLIYTVQGIHDIHTFMYTAANVSNYPPGTWHLTKLQVTTIIFAVHSSLVGGVCVYFICHVYGTRYNMHISDLCYCYMLHTWHRLHVPATCLWYHLY